MHFKSGVGHIGGSLSALDTLLVPSHLVIGAVEQFVPEVTS
jgi:hypothetical protein